MTACTDYEPCPLPTFIHSLRNKLGIPLTHVYTITMLPALTFPVLYLRRAIPASGVRLFSEKSTKNTETVNFYEVEGFGDRRDDEIEADLRHQREVEKVNSSEVEDATTRGCNMLHSGSVDDDDTSVSKDQRSVGDTTTATVSESEGSDAKPTRKKSVCLPTVFLPKELQKAIDAVLSNHSVKDCSKDGCDLTQYLQKRIPPGCEWFKEHKKTGESRSKNDLRFHSSYNPNLVWASKPGKVYSTRDSQRVRDLKSAPNLKYHKRESLAFLAGRTQAVYGTALRVLSEIAKQNESYAPCTLLDFGSGIGTVEWAAHELWKDSIYEYQCVDISSDMLELAKQLRSGGSNPNNMLESEKKELKELIPGVYSRQYLPLSRTVKYDIVVCGHSLGELPSARMRSFTVAALWRKTNDYLVLIEPGNWSGYRIITEARNLILNTSNWNKFEGETEEDLAGHIFSPCPHDHECPLLSDKKQLPRNPCYFAQKVQLSESERHTFLKQRGRHIENFTYIVFKKGKRESKDDQRARLIEPVKKRSRHIICTLCTSEGKKEEIIFTKKKHREVYKEERRKRWGDMLTLKHFMSKLTN